MMKIIMSDFHISIGTLIATPPLEICEDFHPGNSRVLFIDEQLNIDASGSNEDELREAIRIEMDVLWRVYAMAEDATLDSGAIAVKNALRKRFRFKAK